MLQESIDALSAKERRSNCRVWVWLEKRKEVWVAVHTFCKLPKTVVEPASVKPTVNLESTLLFLLKLTFSFLLTSLPLQFGLYIKQMSPTHFSHPAEVRTKQYDGPRWLSLDTTLDQSMA